MIPFVTIGLIPTIASLGAVVTFLLTLPKRVVQRLEARTARRELLEHARRDALARGDSVEFQRLTRELEAFQVGREDERNSKAS